MFVQKVRESEENQRGKDQILHPKGLQVHLNQNEKRKQEQVQGHGR